MSPASRASIAVTALAVLLQTGCAQWVTRPALPRVEFTMSAPQPSGTTAYPPVIETSIRNAGGVAVWYSVGCGCDAMTITVLGPDGHAVYIYDPSSPLPMCPCGLTSFEPGKQFRGPFVFTGTLYEGGHPWPSPKYTAPAGSYTVIIRFSYTTTGEPHAAGDWVKLERRATLAWTP